MNLQEIEDRVAQLDLAEGPEFIYSLLLAYGLPKAGIARVRSGTYNHSTVPGETLWKGRVFDRYETNGADLHAIDTVGADERVQREHPRFVIVRDTARLLALDTVTRDTLDIGLSELHSNTAFFLPWAGIEKTAARDPALRRRQGCASAWHASTTRSSRPTRSRPSRTSIASTSSSRGCCSASSPRTPASFRQACLYRRDRLPHELARRRGCRLASSTSCSRCSTLLRISAQTSARTSADFGYVNGKLFSAERTRADVLPRPRDIVIDCGSLELVVRSTRTSSDR